MTITTLPSRSTEREAARVLAVRENMRRDDWRPRYVMHTGGRCSVENIVFPNGEPAVLARIEPGRPFRVVDHEHLGKFALRDAAARIARAEALRAWESWEAAA